MGYAKSATSDQARKPRGSDCRTCTHGPECTGAPLDCELSEASRQQPKVLHLTQALSSERKRLPNRGVAG